MLRLEKALREIVTKLSKPGDVAGVVVFGSYARGEYGRSSDVDLLILFTGCERPDATPGGSLALEVVGDVEAAQHLPMHIAPMLASVDRPEDVGPELIYNIWTDGVILYSRASDLARFQPQGLAPWAIIRLTLGDSCAKDRVRLSRLLHGMRGRPGILGPQAGTLGRGAPLVAAAQQTAVRQALDEAGATYDVFAVWREA